MLNLLFDKADLILIGVSRSGKTPTAIYLSLQFGIRVANYPLTEEEKATVFNIIDKCACKES